MRFASKFMMVFSLVCSSFVIATEEQPFDQLLQFIHVANCSELADVEAHLKLTMASGALALENHKLLLMLWADRKFSCQSTNSAGPNDLLIPTSSNHRAPMMVASAATMASDIDTSPPELVSFALSSNSVDVSAGLQTVTMTVRLKDASGIGSAYLALQSPQGLGSNFDRNVLVWAADWRATEVADVYEAEVAFALDSTTPAGVWQGRLWAVSDSLGNGGLGFGFSAAQLREAGFEPELVVKSDAIVDTTPPELVAFALSSNSVDVSAGLQTVTMTVRLKDASGIGSAYLALQSPQGLGSNFDRNVLVWAADWRATEVADVYEAEVAFALDSTTPAGVWQGRLWAVSDSLGNGGLGFGFSAAQLRHAGFNADLFINTKPDPDLALSTQNDFIFIPPGTQERISFSIKAETGSLLPDVVTLTFNTDTGLNYRSLSISGAGTYSMSCRVVNSSGSCQIGLPNGLEEVQALFTLETSAEEDYLFSVRVSSSYNELNYQNNNAEVIVTGIRPRFEVSAQVIGNGTVQPSLQQILLGEQASFSFVPDTGYQFSRATGCGVTQVENSLKTLPISSACSIEVVFIPIVYKVELSDQFNNGEVSCNVREADFGSTIICVATAKPGYRFVGWQGQVCPGSARRCEFVLTDNTVLQPIFDVQQAKRKKLPLWLLLNKDD